MMEVKRVSGSICIVSGQSPEIQIAKGFFSMELAKAALEGIKSSQKAMDSVEKIHLEYER